MNTLLRKTNLLFFILFLSCCMTLMSCEKKIKETQTVAITPKVSELVLTQIAESNLKVVAIAQKTQEGKIDNSTKAILQEIEKNHIQLKNKIRKIAKDSFIIIPNTLYDTKTLKNFISEESTNLYLKKIENSLVAELKLYQTIAITPPNNALTELAKEAIPNIEKNITHIQIEQKLK